MIRKDNVEYYGVWETGAKGVYCTLFSPGVAVQVPEGFVPAPRGWFRRLPDYEFWVAAE